jgi:outer membrane receptor for ferric coprogen and ferric-rhodotorulic acid
MRRREPNEVGNRLVNAPDHTLGSVHTLHAALVQHRVGGGVNYVSQRYASQAPATQSPTQFRVLPGYYTVNLMAALPITDQWQSDERLQPHRRILL